MALSWVVRSRTAPAHWCCHRAGMVRRHAVRECCTCAAIRRDVLRRCCGSAGACWLRPPSLQASSTKRWPSLLQSWCVPCKVDSCCLAVACFCKYYVTWHVLWIGCCAAKPESALHCLQAEMWCVKDRRRVRAFAGGRARQRGDDAGAALRESALQRVKAEM